MMDIWGGELRKLENRSEGFNIQKQNFRKKKR